jgi:hypothetical protein
VSAHTPGPWDFNFEENGGYDCMSDAWDICDGLGRLIAKVDLGKNPHPKHVEVVAAIGRLIAKVDLGKNPHPKHVEVAAANAALIAAAPDLYQALTHAVEIIDKWIEPETMGVVRSGDGVLGHYLRDEYLMNLRAALAKARGEQ